MTALILDGKKVRDEIKNQIKAKLREYITAPTLVIFQVGNNPESNTYIRQKVVFGESLGIHVVSLHIPDDENAERTLVQTIETYSHDSAVHGIIVQLPLPPQVSKENVLNSIHPDKDVDGLTKKNCELLEAGRPYVVPATARGIFELLDAYNVNLHEKRIVVVGRSSLVGKPTALLAKSRGGIVTVLHTRTENPKEIMKSADILIVAAGVKNLVGIDSVSKEQVIIDVGIHVDERGGVRTLSGDVDFENVSQVVKAISPVPGGVGPLTVAALYLNLIDLFERQTWVSNKK